MSALTVRKTGVCVCVVLCASFCTGHFVMVPLNVTYLHCLQHSFFEHLFNSYSVTHKRSLMIYRSVSTILLARVGHT